MPIWSPAMLFGSAASGYVIEDAIMLDGGADYLVRDPSSAGNRKTFTFSCWLKRSNLGTTGGTAGNNIFGGDRGSAFSDRLMFGNGDDGAEYLKASFHDDSNGAVQTNALYRDPTAWMNVVWVVDTDQGGSYTASNTVKIYVNGVSQTFSSASYPAEDYETAINNTENQAIGARPGNLAQQHFGGYLAEVILLDGTAESDASKFGELDDNGVWVPIKPSGLTFGTNGFHLDFKVAPGTGNGAGTDVSGNGNNYTDNSLGAANQVPDTCTDDASSNIGNYCTLNPVATVASNMTFANGNRTVNAGTPGNDDGGLCTIAVDPEDSDGWYYEWKLDTSDNGRHMGFCTLPQDVNLLGRTNRSGQYGLYSLGSGSQWATVINGTETGTGVSYGTGSVMFALKNGKLYMGYDGSWLGSANPATESNPQVTGLSGPMVPYFGFNSGTGSNTITANFGQSDFAHTPPTGYKRINTANLPAPTVTKPDDYFGTLLYTGNDTARTIKESESGVEGTSFTWTPDFVWIKSRVNPSAGNFHHIYDVVRGGSAGALYPNSNDVEDAFENGFNAFVAGGFSTTNTDSFFLNSDDNSATYVAWCMKAGGSATAHNVATANVNGAISSTTTLVVDGNSGTIATGMFVAGSGISGTVTVASLSDQNNLVLSSAQSLSNDVALTFSTSAGASLATSVSAADHGGFSIATWTGNGSGGTTIGHGLSRKPVMGIFRRRSLGQDWAVYHEGLDPSAPEDKFINLNGTGTNLSVQDATWLNDTPPSASIWTLGTSGYVNTSGETFVAYSFARTPGLIGAGTFEGVASTDGANVIINDGGSGFKPAFLIIKSIDAQRYWVMHDGTRNPYNPASLRLHPNTNESENVSGTAAIDFLANGFKLRNTSSHSGGSAETYIYLAFAEHPFGGDGVAQAKAR